MIFKTFFWRIAKTISETSFLLSFFLIFSNTTHFFASKNLQRIGFYSIFQFHKSFNLISKKPSFSKAFLKKIFPKIENTTHTQNIYIYIYIYERNEEMRNSYRKENRIQKGSQNWQIYTEKTQFSP
jgi:hypothetical protein